jgi:hypothetical protein
MNGVFTQSGGQWGIFPCSAISKSSNCTTTKSQDGFCMSDKEPAMFFPAMLKAIAPCFALQHASPINDDCGSRAICVSEQ